MQPDRIPCIDNAPPGWQPGDAGWRGWHWPAAHRAEAYRRSAGEYVAHANRVAAEAARNERTNDKGQS